MPSLRSLFSCVCGSAAVPSEPQPFQIRRKVAPEPQQLELTAVAEVAAQLMGKAEAAVLAHLQGGGSMREALAVKTEMLKSYRDGLQRYSSNLQAVLDQGGTVSEDGLLKTVHATNLAAALTIAIAQAQTAAAPHA